MKPTNEINWWIDHTGSIHTRCEPQAPGQALVTGKIYTDSKSGIISRFKDKPADLSLISHELLDVLHTRFPGTRWWIKDPTVNSENKRTKQKAAS